MPLRLTFTGTDEQALDLLSSPYATSILLKRSLDASSHATTRDPGHHVQTFVETVARAVFWPAKHAGTIGMRVLEGEIKLGKTFLQSVVFPHFTVKVRILSFLLLENSIH
jgi:hypothetical protein